MYDEITSTMTRLAAEKTRITRTTKGSTPEIKFKTACLLKQLISSINLWNL